jgi:acyl carrier protein
MDAFPKVSTLMADIFSVSISEITRETSQIDLDNWDSVQHLNLMLALEEEFGVTLDVDDLSALTSVTAILNYLESTCPSA